MREIRLSGSEGGGFECNRFSLPLSARSAPRLLGGKRGKKTMAQTIEVGTLFIKDGTHLPETLPVESEPYLKGWSRVKSLSCSALDRKLSEVGWAFFYMSGEVNVMAFGSNSEKTIRRAVGKVIASMRSGRFNCLEISRVEAKSFLGLPYVTVAGHPRHVQESIYLFQAKSTPASPPAKLLAIEPAV